MEKTIEEVKFIIESRRIEKGNEGLKFLCTGLSARYLRTKAFFELIVPNASYIHLGAIFAFIQKFLYSRLKIKLMQNAKILLRRGSEPIPSPALKEVHNKTNISYLSSKNIF